MRTKKLNNKGFTLVEVIVVAVIVAVLALVAIQLYTGYVKEARRNTAENLAASAASYIQSAINSIGEDDAETACHDVEYNSTDRQWEVTLSPGNIVYFTVPANSTIDVDDQAGTVVATVGVSATDGSGGEASTPYSYKVGTTTTTTTTN